MSEQIHRATYGSPERPLKIGIGESGIEIPAYVLEDGTRVLVRTGMIKALGMVVGGGRTEVKSGHAQEGDKLFQFARTKALEPFISKEVLDRAQHPIEFKLPTGASAYGYEATLLPDICNAVLESRQQGKLSHKQEHIARQCEIIVRGLAIVGIIALVDEATGYQDDRVKDALNEIFQKFLLAEAKKYKVTYPLDFYKMIFRLNNWTWTPSNAQKKPMIISRWTNDLIYARLAPGLLEELKVRNPKEEDGKRKHKHFQFLTDEIGEPRLREHFGGLMALGRVAPNWRKFMDMVERAFPKSGDNLKLELNFSDSEEEK